MTPEQVQTIVDALMFVAGMLGAVILAATWRG